MTAAVIDLNLLSDTLGLRRELARDMIVVGWQESRTPPPAAATLPTPDALPIAIRPRNRKGRAIYVPYEDLPDHEFWDALFAEKGWTPPSRRTLVTIGNCIHCGETIKYESWDCAFCSRRRNEQRSDRGGSK
jgi:hypothetical protein